jgi:hypothetical protein
MSATAGVPGSYDPVTLVHWLWWKLRCHEGSETNFRFEAATNVPAPFQVRWQVVNTGAHAKEVGGLRGEFIEARTNAGEPSSGLVHRESASYTGKHWVEAFILKDGVLWARHDAPIASDLHGGPRPTCAVRYRASDRASRSGHGRSSTWLVQQAKLQAKSRRSPRDRTCRTESAHVRAVASDRAPTLGPAPSARPGPMHRRPWSMHPLMHQS